MNESRIDIIDVSLSANHSSRKFDYFILIIIAFIPVFISSIIIPGLAYKSSFKFVVILFFLFQLFISFFKTRNIFYKMNKTTLSIIIMFMAIQIFTLFINLGTNTITNYLDIANFVIRYLCIYIFFNLPQFISYTNEDLNRNFRKITIFILVASCFNIFINIRYIPQIMQMSVYSINFQSFYMNRNSFAQILYMGVAINLYLLSNKFTYFRFITFIIITFNLLLTFSRASIGSTLVFIVLYLLLNKKIKITTKMTWIMVVIISVIYIFNSSNILQFINSYFIRKNAGLTNRTWIWMKSLKEIGIEHVLFGIGFNTGKSLFNAGDIIINEFHSFYVETIINGGILELLLLLYIFIKIMLQCYKNRSKNYNLAIFYISFIASMLFYGFAESISFFTLGYVGTLFSIMFISLPVAYFGFGGQ